MIAEPDRMALSPRALGRLTFLADLDPLPLVDPTEAARFLDVERHSLACYRSLGDGPPYYKFGRWIRYAWPDLLRHRGMTDGADAAWTAPEMEDAAQPGALVSALTAARFLTLTRFCLDNYRKAGGGPRFCRFGRRIHYPVDELHRWAEQQRKPLNP